MAGRGALSTVLPLPRDRAPTERGGQPILAIPTRAGAPIERILTADGIVGSFLGEFGATVASAVMISLIVALVLMLASCNSGRKKEAEAEQKNPKCMVEKSFFGFSPEGDSVMLYTLTNERDIQISITNYGGIITEIHTPDREGKKENIVLNLDRLGSQ